MAQMVYMKDVAVRLGMDRSRARRYVLGIGYSWRKIRGPDGQIANALTLEEADTVAEYRHQEGFTVASEAREAPEARGAFYIIRLIPDLAPQRVKIGFATSMADRLGAHRTSAPTAEIIKTWPCRRTWERAAADAITSTNCIQIGPEVYDCKDVPGLVAKGDAFFAVMP